MATGIAGLGAVFVSQIGPTTLSALSRTTAGQAVVSHGGNHLDGVISSGTVRQTAATIGNGGVQHALIGAYQYGFTTTFNHLMAISTVVALVGSIGTLALVRQRDFIPSYAADAPVPPAGFDGATGAPAGAGVAVLPQPGTRHAGAPQAAGERASDSRTGVPRVADGNSDELGPDRTTAAGPHASQRTVRRSAWVIAGGLAQATPCPSRRPDAPSTSRTLPGWHPTTRTGPRSLPPIERP